MLALKILVSGVDKVPAPISAYDKARNNLLMSLYVIFPFMLNDMVKSFHPIEDNGLLMVFFRDVRLINLNALQHRARFTQEYFINSILPNIVNEREQIFYRVRRGDCSCTGWSISLSATLTG
jgi:hypothetical protein